MKGPRPRRRRSAGRIRYHASALTRGSNCTAWPELLKRTGNAVPWPPCCDSGQLYTVTWRTPIATPWLSSGLCPCRDRACVHSARWLRARTCNVVFHLVSEIPLVAPHSELAYLARHAALAPSSTGIASNKWPIDQTALQASRSRPAKEKQPRPEGRDVLLVQRWRGEVVAEFIVPRQNRPLIEALEAAHGAVSAFQPR